jgi:hypothetical protein
MVIQLPWQWSIAPVEVGFFFMGSLPFPEQTRANRQQVTLFGSEAGCIPIYMEMFLSLAMRIL